MKLIMGPWTAFGWQNEDGLFAICPVSSKHASSFDGPKLLVLDLCC